MKKTALVCIAALGISASSYAGSLVEGKFSIYGNIGYSTFSMEQVNKSIDDFNSFSYPTVERIKRPSHVNGGLVLGGGAQYGVMDELLVGIGVESLNPTNAESKERFINPPPYSSYTVEEISSFPGIAVGPFFKYAYTAADDVLLTIGGGIDYVFAAQKGKLKYSNDAGEITYESDESISGSSIGMNVMLGGEIFVLPEVSVGADLGYRYAKIGELKFDKTKEVAKDINGKNWSLDYSGVFAKGVVRLYF